MAFLRKKDYAFQIEADRLDQVANAEDERQQAEAAAIREASNYLRHRFDVSKIFITVYPFDLASNYTTGKVIELKADDFVATTAYDVDEIVAYGSFVYVKIDDAIAGVLPTVIESWEKIGKQEGIYTAIADAVAGDYPIDETKYTYGDPRDPQILMYIVDMTLYHLHSSVTPRQIPATRAIRYDGNSPAQTGGAIGWLKMAGKPEGISPDLPLLENEDNPNQGKRIRYGSECSQDNAY